MLAELSILRIVTKLLVPSILLFALYVQFHGDFGPGGGFQAGVIFAAGIILYALVFGLDTARRAVPPALVLRGMPLGVLLYAGTGIVTMLLGGDFLDYNRIDPSQPAHGQHLGILIVELGVGVTVASTMISLFYSFAARGTKE